MKIYEAASRDHEGLSWAIFTRLICIGSHGEGSVPAAIVRIDYAPAGVTEPHLEHLKIAESTLIRVKDADGFPQRIGNSDHALGRAILNAKAEILRRNGGAGRKTQRQQKSRARPASHQS